ncbi:MAG: hypothetical protein ABFD44_01640 [Anaerolineaceae bacterium]
MTPPWMRISTIILTMVISACLLTGSDLMDAGTDARFLRYTRSIEFDHGQWIRSAFWLKTEQASLNFPEVMSAVEQKQIVLETAQKYSQLEQLAGEVMTIYADPETENPDQAVAPLVAQTKEINQRLNEIAPLAETIIQQQVSTILAEQGLTLGGQPIPPVLYHASPLPDKLIISPRDEILQKTSISIQSTLSLDEINKLEERVSKDENVSALVVPVGGIGVYPTMVQQSSDLAWLIGTVCHEWTHNYLDYRPLGWNYSTSGELRTMNETTASLAENELRQLVLERYYPELLPPPAAEPSAQTSPSEKTQEAPVFDFQKEMHATRVHVDELLKAGKIDEAEAYMNARREVFWENGYPIRKLNQAYFAFYGAYADVPGGAAGEDPVGPAVRQLREQSPSLAAFINRIAWMTSFDALKKAVEP